MPRHRTATARRPTTAVPPVSHPSPHRRDAMSLPPHSQTICRYYNNVNFTHYYQLLHSRTFLYANIVNTEQLFTAALLSSVIHKSSHLCNSYNRYMLTTATHCYTFFHSVYYAYEHYLYTYIRVGTHFRVFQISCAKNGGDRVVVLLGTKYI